MSNRRFEVFEYRQVLARMRQGDSDRDIASSHLMGRSKLKTVRQVALTHGWLDPGRPLPDDAELAGIFGRDPKVPRSRISTLEPFRDLVRGWFDADVQGTTIFSALQRNHGYGGSYSAVRRFLLHLKTERGVTATTILEFPPADAAQVDFGAGPVLTHESGIPLKTWIFVMTLAWSRHQYAEIVLDQTVETWLACHRRAFEWLGGCPGRVIIDNAKCAIIRACMYSPEVQRSYASLAEGYSFRIDACPPRDPQKKAYASYCTLCGWWNSDKRRLCRTVATALSFDQDDVADGLVQAAMQVTVAMLTQQPALAPQMNASRAHSELCGEFVGCQHAAFAQAFKPALESIGGADDKDLLVRERFTFPVCITERIKLFGDLPIRAGFEEFVDLRNDFWQRLANQCNGLGLIDLQGSRSPAAKAYMDRDAFGLDQGYVFNEQSDHAFALDRHDSLVIPDAGEVFGERLNLRPCIAA
jgi:Integrase core domain